MYSATMVWRRSDDSYKGSTTHDFAVLYGFNFYPYAIYLLIPASKIPSLSFPPGDHQSFVSGIPCSETTKEKGSEAVGIVRFGALETLPIGQEAADQLDPDRSEPEARLTGIPLCLDVWDLA